MDKNDIFNKRTTQKANFEILFNDSPEYFPVRRARMLIEGPFIRFICFDDSNNFIKDTYFPIRKIHRIERYQID